MPICIANVTYILFVCMDAWTVKNPQDIACAVAKHMGDHAMGHRVRC